MWILLQGMWWSSEKIKTLEVNSVKAETELTTDTL
jgi:hypothetical protein